MPRKASAPPPRLTTLQLAVMQVLWSRDEASVADVQRAMTGRRLALTTVATMLVRLEQRGLVSHRAEGRQYIYRSRVSPADVRETVTRELLRNLFDGDVTAFVTQLLDSRKLTREEVADLQRLGAVVVEEDRAIVCVVGDGLRDAPGIAGRVFDSIRDINIDLISQGASRINLTFVVDAARAQDVVRRVHAAVFGGARREVVAEEPV